MVSFSYRAPEAPGSLLESTRVSLDSSLFRESKLNPGDSDLTSSTSICSTGGSLRWNTADQRLAQNTVQNLTAEEESRTGGSRHWSSALLNTPGSMIIRWRVLENSMMFLEGSGGCFASEVWFFLQSSNWKSCKSRVCGYLYYGYCSYLKWKPLILNDNQMDFGAAVMDTGVATQVRWVSSLHVINR